MLKCLLVSLFQFYPNFIGHSKQAYTSELENKVSRLEEENERLRKRKVSLSFKDSVLVFVPLTCFLVYGLLCNFGALWVGHLMKSPKVPTSER